MDRRIKFLMGSESRDIFKLVHKLIFPSDFYALDFDFLLITPKGILVGIDYKKLGDEVTWSEGTAYDDLLRMGLEIYIVQGELPYPLQDALKEQIKLIKALKGNELSEEMTLVLKDEFSKFEVFKYLEGRQLEKISDNYFKWEHQIRGRELI